MVGDDLEIRNWGLRREGVSHTIVSELPECCECLKSLLRTNMREVSSDSLDGGVRMATSRVHRSLGGFNNFNRRKCKCGIGCLCARVNGVLKLSEDRGFVVVNTNGLKRTLTGCTSFREDKFVLGDLFSIGPQLRNMAVEKVPIHVISRLRSFLGGGSVRVTTLALPGSGTVRITSVLMSGNIGKV